jgi:hypothetical protein
MPAPVTTNLSLPISFPVSQSDTGEVSRPKAVTEGARTREAFSLVAGSSALRTPPPSRRFAARHLPGGLRRKGGEEQTLTWACVILYKADRHGGTMGVLKKRTKTIL